MLRSSQLVSVAAGIWEWGDAVNVVAIRRGPNRTVGAAGPTRPLLVTAGMVLVVFVQVVRHLPAQLFGVSPGVQQVLATLTALGGAVGYIVAGASPAAMRKVATGSLLGATAAISIAVLIANTVRADYWGVAVWLLLVGAILRACLRLAETYFLAASVGTFAAVLCWWFLTGLEGLDVRGTTAMFSPFQRIYLIVLLTALLGCALARTALTMAAYLEPRFRLR